MRSLSTTLSGEAASVAAARRFVTGALDQLGRADFSWSGCLVISELATNALLHARSATITITVSVDGGPGVRLEVSDSSSAVPRMRSYDEQSTTGRGLRMVQDVSTAWGVEKVATGKFVWVELADPTADGTAARSAGQGEATPAADDDIDVDALLAMFDEPDETDVQAGAHGRGTAHGPRPTALAGAPG